jgi:hypothetical protein
VAPENNGRIFPAPVVDPGAPCIAQARRVAEVLRAWRKTD